MKTVSHRIRTRDNRETRDARRLVRRSEFVDAAVAVIRRDGPGASMERIAAEMGVTKPILYRHVGDRGELVGAVGERFVADLLAELRAALASDGTPADLLESTIDAYLSFVERDPAVYRFLVQRLASGSDDAIGAFIRQIGQEVAVVIGEQLRAAGRDSGAAEPWAFGIVGMVHLAGDWWLDRQSMPRRRLTEYLAALLWDGLSSVTGPAAPSSSSSPRRSS